MILLHVLLLIPKQGLIDGRCPCNTPAGIKKVSVNKQ